MFTLGCAPHAYTSVHTSSNQLYDHHPPYRCGYMMLNVNVVPYRAPSGSKCSQYLHNSMRSKSLISEPAAYGVVCLCHRSLSRLTLGLPLSVWNVVYVRVLFAHPHVPLTITSNQTHRPPSTPPMRLHDVERLCRAKQSALRLRM